MSLKPGRFRFGGRGAWLLVALALGASGCLPSKEKQGAQRRPGNGEAYGISYFSEPGYSCVNALGIRIPSYVNALKQNADGTFSLLGDLCSTAAPQPVDTNAVENAGYYPELTGFGANVYEKSTTAPNPLDEQRYFVEAWCRSADATPSDGHDVSVHYSLYDRFPKVRFRKPTSKTVDIPENAYLWERAATRTETNGQSLYDMRVEGPGAADLSLTVNWGSSLPGGVKYAGTLLNKTTGTSYAMHCRGVSVQQTFRQRMALLSQLLGQLPGVPQSGGRFFEYNEARTCRLPSGSNARGYLSALLRDDTGPQQIQPSYCRPTDPPVTIDPAGIETSSYNPRYIGYGSSFYEYRPESEDADRGYGYVPLIWCRTTGANATNGMDLLLLFSLLSDNKVFRFASDGITKANLSDQWYIGHQIVAASLTESATTVTVQHLLSYREIRLEISKSPSSAAERKFPATLFTSSQGQSGSQDMTCRVSSDIIPE